MAGARETPTRTPSPGAEVVVPADWSSAISFISSGPTPPVVLVCGPKNSGKSTFSRLLLNSLLPRYGRVGYLDTDVGQPEFSPPGCLSFHVVDEAIADLLSPTLREAERCCFFGDISSKRDPETYLNCLFHLYDYFVEKYRCGVSQMLPLIVNTPGWVKGAGFDMLVEMLRYICPTIVIQIRITKQSKNLPDGMFWLDGGQTGLEMINIDAARRDSNNRMYIVFKWQPFFNFNTLVLHFCDASTLAITSAAVDGFVLTDLNQKDAFGTREHQLVEYFKQCFPGGISLTTNKKLAYGLASLPPYEVSFSDVTVMHLHCQVPRSEIWRSLNATIVGLAISCDTSEAARSIPWCVGLGIVRGVDVHRGLLYVITPVPLQCLQSVDLLLQGLIEIPTSLLQVRGCVSPYFSTNVLHKI